jgi:hypothetical protein
MKKFMIYLIHDYSLKSNIMPCCVYIKNWKIQQFERLNIVVLSVVKFVVQMLLVFRQCL